ncbi:MAG: hypothetical protein M3N13_00195, partial [Candidatus Eremiobacteraeota bacterium]|nr:hypothetical protein [Candidatus Eremiobacteraeota bacterium]
RIAGEDGREYAERVRALWEYANANLSANRYALAGLLRYVTSDAKSLVDVVAYLQHYQALASALLDTNVPEIVSAAEVYIGGWNALLKFARQEMCHSEMRQIVQGVQEQALYYAARAWKNLGAICGEWGLRLADLSIPLHVRPTTRYENTGPAGDEGGRHA